MRHFKFIFTGLLLISTLAFAGAPSGGTPALTSPWTDNTGGPDAYGYTWIDSDEPGGPPVQWVDITGIGTQVVGLGDDNYVGPFNIGFNFNYYWYSFSQIYIGSNGYIKVPPAYNIASPFPDSIPLPALPNDYIAAYCGDLDFTAGGSAYYYTNSLDTFIVSWLAVPAWNQPGSFFTFQILLNGADNTIHFNYGVDQGQLGTGNDIIIGIENNNGQVGLEHSHDTLIPHDNYTVVFHRPDTTTYVVHDLAAFRVMNANSQAIFVLQDSSYAPVAWVKNVGNQVETGAQVRCTIVDSSNLEFYNQTVAMGTINPGQETQIGFPGSFTPPIAKQYKMTVRLILLGDMNPNNNTLIGEIDAITIPGVFYHDRGTANFGSNWQGGSGGWGQYYVPPYYPVHIDSLKFFLTSVTGPPQTCIAKILDDDGMNGGPGTVLFTQNVNITLATASWYSVYVPGITINSGGVYAAWQQTAEGVTYLGLDSIPPASRLCWELTGTWAPYRDMETEDALIRLIVDEGAAPAPTIAFSTEAIDFGEVTINTISAPEDLWIYNTGISDLIINSMAYFGAPSLIFPNQGYTAGMIIGPGDSALIQFSFHPLGTVFFESHLIFNNNSVNAPLDTAVYLSGTGIPVSGVDDNWISNPTYRLDNCYPNPFNAETSISFSLEKEGFTTLRVYNLAGEMVSELINGEMEAGNHSIYFNANSLSTGIYFYSLESGDFKAVKKMILMK